MKKITARLFDLITKIGTYRRYQVGFALVVGGLLMVFGSNYFEAHEIGSKFMRTSVLEVGIACIIAAIAEFILLQHMSEIFQKDVLEMKTLLSQMSGTLRQEVEHDMKILSHCREHQLLDVMPPRNREQEDAAVNEINSAIETARGEICIIVFTLQDILNSRTSLAGPLKNLLARNKQVLVKLLLIDPTSDAAHIRVIAEEGPDTRFEDSNLHSALRENFYAIQRMIRAAEKKDRFKIEALFYNILPSFYMVSTSKEVFIEPYHLGDMSGEDSTIGGIVPLFRFGRESRMYKSAQSHFANIWQGFGNGKTPAGMAHPTNRFIQVKTMDDVDREIDRRLSQRRGPTSQMDGERRFAPERRERRNLEARTAAG